MGTFGAVTVCVPRARLATPEGRTTEWRNTSLPAYQRLTRRAEALIAGAYLSGTNTRRVRRALAALFGGAIGKDVVSRVWRKVKTDWDAWTRRDLSAEPIIRLILDGTVVRVPSRRRTFPSGSVPDGRGDGPRPAASPLRRRPRSQAGSAARSACATAPPRAPLPGVLR